MTPGSAGHWDDTPGRLKGSETPGATPSSRQWDATPGHATPGHATPSTPGKRNRWDETPRWGETPRADRGECHSDLLNQLFIHIYTSFLQVRQATLDGQRHHGPIERALMPRLLPMEASVAPAGTRPPPASEWEAPPPSLAPPPPWEPLRWVPHPTFPVPLRLGRWPCRCRHPALHKWVP